MYIIKYIYIYVIKINKFIIVEVVICWWLSINFLQLNNICEVRNAWMFDLLY